jgi:predicted dehydrogenase
MIWLVGAGYWGSKIKTSLEKFDIQATVIDIKNGQSIADINTHDPVILATPLWDHYDQCMELLIRGHDVYVEKPAAETAPQVAKIKEVIKPNQLFMVGHIFIHHPQIHEIKQLIDSNAIGTLQHISSKRLNWGIYQTKTTPVLSLAAHDISILHFFLSHDTTVTSARGWHLSTGHQFDRVWFNGHSAGVTYDVDVSWCWPHRTRQTIFIGSRGQIIWDQDTNTITLCNNRIGNNRAEIGNTVEFDYTHELSPLENELKHWVDCVNTRSQPSTGITEAYHVAVTIDRVHKALGSSG